MLQRLGYSQVGEVVTGFEVVVQVVLVVEDVEDVDDVDEEVGVLVGAELDDEDWGGALQGSVDSKSVATYKFRVELPPQVSELSPVQGILHELAGKGAVPLPKTTPQ